ncbi:MAG: hypothetical protein FWF02_05055 [Micrococcales bacterium]|nr:hypothetical protein [Micrococcales bacterium]MCL2667062.1 hypothetical protein [Micrococcales bacterium]
MFTTKRRVFAGLAVAGLVLVGSQAASAAGPHTITVPPIVVAGDDLDVELSLCSDLDATNDDIWEVTLKARAAFTTPQASTQTTAAPPGNLVSLTFTLLGPGMYDVTATCWNYAAATTPVDYEPATVAVVDPDLSIATSVSTVAAGAVLLVTGEGFDPGDEVVIELHSTPVVLGKTLANDKGAVSASVTIPAGTTLGQHWITLAGTSGSFTATVITVSPTPPPGGGVPKVISDVAPGGSGSALVFAGLAVTFLVVVGVVASRRSRTSGE